MTTMYLHPAYDTQTRTWYVEGYEYEAPTIKELLQKIKMRTKLSIVVKDYHPEGFARVPMGSFTECEKAYREKFVGTAGRGAPLPNKLDDKKISPQQSQRHPDGFKSATDFSEIDRDVMIERTLDMWAKGFTIKQISITLKLKYEYVGTTIIPQARHRGDKRAEVRNHKTFGVRKGPVWDRIEQ